MSIFVRRDFHVTITENLDLREKENLQNEEKCLLMSKSARELSSRKKVNTYL